MKQILTLLLLLPMFAFGQGTFKTYGDSITLNNFLGELKVRQFVMPRTPYCNRYADSINSFYFSATSRSFFYKDSATKAWTELSGSGGGGVTAVNTGYGLLGGPITTTGTAYVDTTKITTRFYLFSNYYTQAQTANLVNVRKLISDSVNIDGYTTRRQTAADIHDSLTANHIPATPTQNGYMDSNSYYMNMLEASTGVYLDSGMTVEAGNMTYKINDVYGWIVINTGASLSVPRVKKIHYAGSTGNSPILAGDATYVLIDTAGTVIQQSAVPTPKQRRENLYIGKVVHPDHTSITAVNNNPDYSISTMSALRDLWTPIKLINDNIVASPNGANLNINLSAGYLWGNGINFVIDPKQPNTTTYAGAIAATFQYRTQAGTGGFTNVTTIDATNYDLNGIVTPVGGGSRATNQRIYLFPTGQIRIQYGQEWYSSLNNAIAGLDSEPFVVNPNNASTGILIGVLSVRSNATDLTNTSQAVFRLVSKFGELASGSSGISTTTLQQAYDNSAIPQITTNATEGAVTFRRGSNADIDTVLAIQNGAGQNKIRATGNGYLIADSLHGKLSGSDIYPALTNGTVTSVTAGTGLSGGVITSTGTISMPNTGTPSTYGSQTQVPVFTTDAQGRVTAVTNTDIYKDTTISANYTLTALDNRRTIHCTNGSNINVTIPTGLAVTFKCDVFQENTGNVVFVASGTTLNFVPNATTKTLKLGAGVYIGSFATANTFTVQGALQP